MNQLETITATAETVSSNHLATAQGIRLYHRDWGSGQPILFVHGWALNSDQWQYQMIHLAGQGFRCIAYDLRGHGRSSDPGTNYDPDSMAADLAHVIEALGLHDVTLVGHSLGTAIIVRYLTNFGDSRVKRAALLGTSLPFSKKTSNNPNALDDGIRQEMRAAWLQDLPKWLWEAAPGFFTPDVSPGMMQWAVGMCLQASLKALIEFQDSFVDTDFREELKNIRVPVLLIHGDRDVSEPLELTARRTARLLPNCRLNIYEGAPHGIMLTHMDRVNEDLAAFVSN